MKIVKQTVNAPPRKLEGKWTVEPAEDYPMEENESVLHELAKEIEKEINWELTKDLLTNTIGGWKCYTLGFVSDEVTEWALANCKGLYKNHKYDWLFESEQDYVMFTLRWS